MQNKIIAHLKAVCGRWKTQHLPRNLVCGKIEEHLFKESS